MFILFFTECLCKCNHGEDLDKCDIKGNLKSRERDRGEDLIDYSSSSPEVNVSKSDTVKPDKWKPLLLIIPLRLGLTDTNIVYVESLKVS